MSSWGSLQSIGALCRIFPPKSFDAMQPWFQLPLLQKFHPLVTKTKNFALNLWCTLDEAKHNSFWISSLFWTRCLAFLDFYRRLATRLRTTAPVNSWRDFETDLAAQLDSVLRRVAPTVFNLPVLLLKLNCSDRHRTLSWFHFIFVSLNDNTWLPLNVCVALAYRK